MDKLDKDLTIDPNYVSTVECGDSDLTHIIQLIDFYYAVFGYRVIDVRPGNPKDKVSS